MTMKCAIMNNRFTVFMDQGTTAMGLVMERRTNRGDRQRKSTSYYDFMSSFRHIMQKPDLSRAQLKAWLYQMRSHRRTQREAARKWTKFMMHCTGNANGNIAENVG